MIFSILALLLAVTPTHQLSLTKTNDPNALCLDGSPASFYASLNASSPIWVLQIAGGGWCYDEQLCLARSHTHLGSSTKLASQMEGHGVLSSDPAVSGAFAHANRVRLNYCDGASFTGTRKQPLVVNGTALHMKGHFILHAIWDELLAQGMDKATRILVAGESAGGLAVFLHADELASRTASPSTIVKAMPQSGFFLDYPNVDGVPIYGPQMRYVAMMQESKAALPTACVTATANWTDCIFAQNVVPTLKASAFVINSANDEWQMGNEWTPGSTDGGAKALHKCEQHPTACTTAALNVSDAYIAPFSRIWSESLQQRPNEGDISSFLHTCITHVQSGSDAGWTTMSIDNGKLADLVLRWFFDDAVVTSKDLCLNAPVGYPCNPMCG